MNQENMTHQTLMVSHVKPFMAPLSSVHPWHVYALWRHADAPGTQHFPCSNNMICFCTIKIFTSISPLYDLFTRVDILPWSLWSFCRGLQST